MLADSGEHNKEPYNTANISSALSIYDRTIDRMKKKFVEEGIENVLERKCSDTSTQEIKFDGAFEAKIIAIACADQPNGKARWTVRHLAEKAVEMKIIDSVSSMTAKRKLKN
jgi:hypothetical protein